MNGEAREATEKRTRGRKRAANPAASRYDAEHAGYYNSLGKRQRCEIDRLEATLSDHGDSGVPLRFRIIRSAAPPTAKRIALAHADSLFSGDAHASDKAKMTRWVDAFLRLPLGVVKKMPLDANASRKDVKMFVSDAKKRMDDAVFGHDEAKTHMLMILSRLISKPEGRGAVIGIHGPPGCGKTTLVRHCLASSLGAPMQMIALGGLTDGSALTGHLYTYEGSTYGGIASCLMHAGCMNPVILLDELDKVGVSERGREIVSALIHLTDATQNDAFRDNYFGGVPIDVSRAVIVLTFNDVSLVDPVLRDRMTVISTDGYSAFEKRTIVRRHILPRVAASYGIENATITDDAVDQIVRTVDPEPGVRNAERAVDSLVGSVNLTRMMSEDIVEKSIHIDAGLVKKLLVNRPSRCSSRPPEHMYV